MYVHALHTVHAVPDLRIAGGRLGDGFRIEVHSSWTHYLDDRETPFDPAEIVRAATVKSRRLKVTALRPL